MANDLNLWSAATAFEDIGMDLQRIEHTAYILSASQVVDQMESDAFTSIAALCEQTRKKLRKFEDDFTQAHKAQQEAAQ